jgi:hypothetical protein
MVEKRATIVKEFLGWAATTDKQFALLGFRDQYDKAFNIAIPEGALKQAIISLINSTGAFKKLSMEGGGDVVISTDWFEFGDSEQGKFLRLRLVPSGGHLTFSPSRSNGCQHARCFSWSTGTGGIHSPST